VAVAVFWLYMAQRRKSTWECPLVFRGCQTDQKLVPVAGTSKFSNRTCSISYQFTGTKQLLWLAVRFVYTVWLTNTIRLSPIITNKTFTGTDIDLRYILWYFYNENMPIYASTIHHVSSVMALLDSHFSSIQPVEIRLDYQWRREARARQVKWPGWKVSALAADLASALAVFFLSKEIDVYRREHIRNDTVSVNLPTAKICDQSQVSINVIFFHQCLGNKDCN